MMKKQKFDMLNTLGYNQKIVKFTKYKISTNFYGGLKEIIEIHCNNNPISKIVILFKFIPLKKYYYYLF